MPLRDYFHSFSTIPESVETYDYVIQFIDIPVPDLRQFPELTQICDWAAYNHDSFRLWSHLAMDEFEQRFARVTKLDPAHFQIVYSHNFKDKSFF